MSEEEKQGVDFLHSLGNKAIRRGYILGGSLAIGVALNVVGAILNSGTAGSKEAFLSNSSNPVFFNLPEPLAIPTVVGVSIFCAASLSLLAAGVLLKSLSEVQTVEARNMNQAIDAHAAPSK